MLNAQSGQLLRDYYIGAPMAIGVAIGAAVSGQEYILVPVGTCSLEAVSTCPGTTPGDLVALSLQNVPPSTNSSVSVSQSVSTTLSVSTTTTTTTTTVVSSTGGDTLYGVAAVAVIFIIISGYLAMRGRKPAS